MKIKASLKSGIAACFVIAACQNAHAVENAGSLQGVITDKAGKPTAGAFVKLKNAERRLTFMVISQNKGVFNASDLPPGRYTVQSVGGNFESSWLPADVSAGKATKIDLSLRMERGPLLPHSWPGRLPEDDALKLGYGSGGENGTATLDLPAGDGMQLVQTRCTTCHDLGRIKVARWDEASWRNYVRLMRINMATAKLPDLTDAEAATITSYLATNFKRDKPYDENSRLPTKLLQGKARNYRIVTYDLPTPFSDPHDIAVDPAGVGWAAEWVGRLIRFDPKTLEATEIDTPDGPAPRDRQRLGNPQIDSHGVLWTVDGPNNRWLRFDTQQRKFTDYLFPEGHGNAGGNSMVIRSDGLLFSTGSVGVRSFNPTTLEWKFFTSPSAKSKPGAYGIAASGDGAVWWAEDLADKMARLDPVTGDVQEYPLPVPNHALPRRMNSDWDGNLWVGLWKAGKLMKIDYKTKRMTVYTPPTPIPGDYSVVADKKNKLIWVSQQQADEIARFDPKRAEWVEFPLPRAQSDTRRIEIDPTNPNRVFFSGNTANLVGFIEYLPDKR